MGQVTFPGHILATLPRQPMVEGRRHPRAARQGGDEGQGGRLNWTKALTHWATHANPSMGERARGQRGAP